MLLSLTLKLTLNIKFHKHISFFTLISELCSFDCIKLKHDSVRNKEIIKKTE